jgi:hypothetical protein
MKILIEDYERRLNTIEETIKITSNTGSQHDIAKMARLNAKAREYRTFISELNEAQRRVDEAEAQEEDRISTLARLYYRYGKTSNNDIREYLKHIKIVKMEKHAGGTVTKYYPLNTKSMKDIKANPRNISLTFDASEITPRAIAGLKVYKTVTYLCKSTSRFFLKPDIGEIFDAIDFHDLYGDKFDAICFSTNYETLPNTDGEHHIMEAILLTNVKARQKKEKQKAVQELHRL